MPASRGCLRLGKTALGFNFAILMMLAFMGSLQFSFFHFTLDYNWVSRINRIDSEPREKDPNLRCLRVLGTRKHLKFGSFQTSFYFVTPYKAVSYTHLTLPT